MREPKSGNPPLRRRGLVRAGVALALHVAGPLPASESVPVPDESARAGIAACTGAAGKDDLVGSLCQNRNGLVSLIALCERVDSGDKRLDPEVLAQWDRRNAPFLRWLGEFVADSPDEGQVALSAGVSDGAGLPLPPAGPSIASLMQEGFEGKFQSAPPETRGMLCATLREYADAGEFDVEPPAGR